MNESPEGGDVFDDIARKIIALDTVLRCDGCGRIERNTSVTLVSRCLRTGRWPSCCRYPMTPAIRQIAHAAAA